MPSRITFRDGCDGLDDAPLRAGETIAIKWGGVVLMVEVQIEMIPYGDGEHHKAYFSLSARGGQTKIYLVGFQAQRIK